MITSITEKIALTQNKKYEELRTKIKKIESSILEQEIQLSLKNKELYLLREQLNQLEELIVKQSINLSK